MTVSLLLRDERGEFREERVGPEGATLGRARGNDIQLSDIGVSRRHAAFEWLDGTLLLRDLGSSDGSHLDGSRINGRTQLADGQIVRFSKCHCLIRMGAIREGDREILERQNSGRRGLDSTAVTLALPALDDPSTSGVAPARLAMLEEVSRTLQSLRELDEILTVLLGVAFDVVGPCSGSIILLDEDGAEMRPAVTHPEEHFGYSRTILDEALSQRATLVVSDVREDERFLGVQSIEDQAIRSAICCPLISRGRILGALYLDTRLELFASQSEDVGFLNLIACYAAAAIESACLLGARSREARISRLEGQALVARSTAMRDAVAKLEAAAREPTPLIIEGEAGTGKLLAARHVHMAGRRDSPFFVLDCDQLPARDLRTALFGEEEKADAGAWWEAAGGTLVLEHVGSLDLLAQELLLERLRGGRESQAPDAPRIVATSSTGLGKLVADQGFSRRLAELLSRDKVVMPRLRDRGADILPLARAYLAEFAGSEARSLRLSEEAERTLAAAKYREGNASELRSTVELAAVLCEDAEIQSEHIFTGAKARDHRLEIDLGSGGLFSWLRQRSVHRAIELSFAAFFLALAGGCLFWSAGTVGRAANAVVWGVWWPGLLLLFLAIGRLWCTWCPISRMARFAQSLWGRQLRPPQWLKEHARWISAGLLLLILWAEFAFDMPHHPSATGIFLLSLMLIAAAGAIFVKREAWCRFACPLGTLSACFSVPATVHVHANAAICSTQCKTHECHKGSDEEAGCPVSLHPLYLKDTHYCKLCMACVRNCPNGSARLWMRPPLQDLWALAELNSSLIPMSLTIALFAPLLLAASGGRAFTSELVGFSLISVLLGAAVVGLDHLLLRHATREGEQRAARIAFAFVLLAWGPFMAFHLGHVPGLAGLRLSSGANAAMAAGGTGISVLPLLQFAAIAASLGAALYVLWRIEGSRRPRWGVATISVLYAALSGALVV